MKKYTKDEILNFKSKANTIFEEEIVVYPTDAYYSIGCDATNTELVDKLRQIKKMGGLEPFTIIAPSIEWIKENFVVDASNSKYVQRLDKSIDIDGKTHCLTLILELKNKNCIAPNVAPGLKTVAVKIPEHWISTAIHNFNRPFICSSANKIGENLISDPADLNEDILHESKSVIIDGIIKIKPTTIIRPYGYKK